MRTSTSAELPADGEQSCAGERVSAFAVKGLQAETDHEERRGHVPEPTRRLPMAVEQDRLVTRGSLRAIRPTTAASWGGVRGGSPRNEPADALRTAASSPFGRGQR